MCHQSINWRNGANKFRHHICHKQLHFDAQVTFTGYSSKIQNIVGDVTFICLKKDTFFKHIFSAAWRTGSWFVCLWRGPAAAVEAWALAFLSAFFMFSLCLTIFLQVHWLPFTFQKNIPEHQRLPKGPVQMSGTTREIIFSPLWWLVPCRSQLFIFY